MNYRMRFAASARRSTRTTLFPFARPGNLWKSTSRSRATLRVLYVPPWPLPQAPFFLATEVRCATLSNDVNSPKRSR